MKICFLFLLKTNIGKSLSRLSMCFDRTDVNAFMVDK
jgi:hypothetical protein